MSPRKKQANKPDFIMGLCDSSRTTMELGAEAVNNDPVLFREVLELSFTQPYPINMRTARVVEICCWYNPSLILPMLDEVIERMAASKTDGVKRSYLKIIDDYTGIDSIDDPGMLLQTCFDWMMSPKEAVSIRYHALGIILKICNKIPEITPELISGIHFILEEGNASKGLQNFCKKTLKTLQRRSY